MASGAHEKTASSPLTPVMEDYLEAIFDLDQEKKVVRVKDIAKRLGVKMPTVTSMLKNLNERGLVNYEKYEYVELTRKGVSVGAEMRRRHEVLLEFLVEILKIDHATADGEACKMEHALSMTTLERFVEFMAFIHRCPRAGDDWLDRFDQFLECGHQPEACKSNMASFKCELSDRISRDAEKE